MKHNSLLVAVAGPTCSGKSTLESELGERFGPDIALVSFDDFFVGLKALGDTQVTNWESPDLYRWGVYTETIQKLRQGEVARFEPHSHEAKQAGITERIVEPRGIVLITGFLALYATEVNELLDVKVYIDIPEDEIIRRRLERSKGRPAGAWNSEDYIHGELLPATREFVMPQRSIADHVIDGSQPPQLVAEQVIDIIRTSSRGD